MNQSNFKLLLAAVLVALSFRATLLSVAALATNADFSVHGLRCEYLSNPLGISSRPWDGIRGPRRRALRRQLGSSWLEHLVDKNSRPDTEWRRTDLRS